MDQILVVVLVEVCSKGAEQLWLGLMAMERFANFNDEVTGGRRSVRLEEELNHATAEDSFSARVVDSSSASLESLH